MRVAFLPVVVLLAGGVAWGQATAGAATTRVQLTLRTAAPVVVPEAEPNPSQALIVNQEKALTLPLEQRSQALARLAAQRAAAQTSGLELIPTQWPHAKAEQIPTQWKAQVVLVGQAPLRPAKQPPASGAGVVVAPR